MGNKIKIRSTFEIAKQGFVEINSKTKILKNQRKSIQKTEETQEKYRIEMIRLREADLVVDSGSGICPKTIKNKIRIQVKVGEFDMKEADLKELGEDEGDYKSLVQSLDTWTQDRSSGFLIFL